MAVATIPGAAKHGLSVERHDWTAWADVAGTWSSIANQREHVTLFLTTEAVQVWLEVFGQQLRPELLVFKAGDGQAIAACVVVRRTERKGPFFVRRVYLNTAGEDDRDSPCLEYNELLCVPGHELATARALREYLDDAEPWDEVHAPGMVDGSSLAALQAVFGDTREVADVKPCYYVDLDDVRRSRCESFIEKIASRERTKVRQNLRRYSDVGPLELEHADSAEAALGYLDRLAALHQQTWTSRGLPGSFAAETFYDYHRRLITRCFPLGRVELLHLRAGSTTVGYHYNFVAGGRTYFYQCGYDYGLGDKLSPGVVLHALAIGNALEQGRRDYEFMAGDVEYKRRLATASRKMYWIAWQAPTIKMRSFELARLAKRALVQRFRDPG